MGNLVTLLCMKVGRYGDVLNQQPLPRVNGADGIPGRDRVVVVAVSENLTQNLCLWYAARYPLKFEWYAEDKISRASRLCSRMKSVCSEERTTFSLARTSPATNSVLNGPPALGSPS